MIVIIISSVFFFLSGRWTHCFLPCSDHVNAKKKTHNHEITGTVTTQQESSTILDILDNKY